VLRRPAAGGLRVTIRLLPPQVADAIAAGEVVERPASVVKELLENSIDAGAGRITVEVRGAGRTLIRVSDDGTGIPAGELRLAFQRHATSKLATVEDLSAVGSLGFRGEALASVAAVSDLECRSGGARLRLRAGEVLEEGVAMPVPGTAIEVRDLFLNTPARLKFLKTAATETAACLKVVQSYALLYPEVRFEAVIEGRSALKTTGRGGSRAAAAAVLGASVASEMLEVGDEGVKGLASQPRLSRGSRDGILLGVNGRPIASRALGFAVEECYLGALERGRYPVVVVDIEVPAGELDVNVHPAKREVRFREEGAVFAALQRAVRSALGASEPVHYHTPQAVAGVASARVAEPQLVVHSAAALPLEEPIPSSYASAALRPIGQVGPGYLVAEGAQGLVLVDQHAAHERVLYNRLLERLKTGVGASQPLLMPQAVDVEPSLIAAAADHRADLAALGLEYEEFGPRSLRITAVPVEMPAGRATAAVQETLAALSETRGDQAMHKAAAALACHSAVRFGDVLDIAEQRRLLADLETAQESVTCPHGRPTRLVVEWQELTRHFRRNY